MAMRGEPMVGECPKRDLPRGSAASNNQCARSRPSDRGCHRRITRSNRATSQVTLHAEPIGRCTHDVMDEVRARLALLLGY